VTHVILHFEEFFVYNIFTLKRLYLDTSSGQVLIRILSPTKKVATNTCLHIFNLIFFMGQLSDLYYLPIFNNTWAMLVSQLMFGMRDTLIEISIQPTNAS